jgi:general secretion pathway protein A
LLCPIDRDLPAPGETGATMEASAWSLQPMYTEFYGLERKPFNMTPDPAFLFLTEQHREALAGLTYAILDRKGFLVLSGMAGCGKTTLLAWVLQRLPGDRIQSSVILNPTLKPDEFLELAMLDFGIPDIPASKAQRLWKLQKFLLKGKQEGKVSVLIIDEAHKLNAELLEEIRLLGNFEVADEKLLQVLLLGQSELDDVLSRPDLWQFKQRISVRLSLAALSANEVEHYIQHRWKVAGGKNAPPFSPGAIATVRKRSKGIPRVINSICDNALMLAFADQAASVTAEHIEAAAADLQLIEKQAAPVTPVTPAIQAPAMPPPVPAPVNGTAAAVPPVVLKPVERKQSLLGRWADRLGLRGSGIML